MTNVSDASLLARCERFELSALQRYQQALELDLPRIARAVVQRHIDASRTELRGLHTAMQPHAA